MPTADRISLADNEVNPDFKAPQVGDDLSDSSDSEADVDGDGGDDLPAMEDWQRILETTPTKDEHKTYPK